MVITEPRELSALCERLRAAGTFALDMEFQRERTYWPCLQLLQVGIPGEAAAVDPLAIEDLTPLFNLIADPSLTKIVHAGRQDAEIFFNATETVPRSIYDTQVAAALVGLGEQVGYAALVQKLVGVRIAKTERITDWGRRPLRDAQVEYALNDVIHLHEIKEHLDRDLEKLGRVEWLAEELTFYEQESLYRANPEQLFRKVSGWRTLNRRGMGILRELAVWRENEAADRDIPRQRVLPDDVLIEVALRKPDTIDDLRPLRRLHPRDLERNGDALLAVVQRGLSIPEDELPRSPKTQRDDPELGFTADLLSVLLRLRARENKIATSYLGNQKDVAALASWLANGRDGEEPALITGWRKRMVGGEMLDLFDGRLKLSIDTKGRVRVESV